jgi:hypothetical protein
MLRVSAVGTFPPLKDQFRASDFSIGDTENRIVGGRDRHTTVIQFKAFKLNLRKEMEPEPESLTKPQSPWDPLDLNDLSMH